MSFTFNHTLSLSDVVAAFEDLKNKSLIFIIENRGTKTFFISLFFYLVFKILQAKKTCTNLIIFNFDQILILLSRVYH